MLLSQKEGVDLDSGLDLFLVTLGEKANEKGFHLMQMLRSLGVWVLMDHEGRSLKNQMKQANKQQARFALILGENELANQEAALKNMGSGEQEMIILSPDFESWAEIIKSKLD